MEHVQIGLWVIAGLVVVALLFDFMNGFHDAANAIATVVSTGVLKPHQAVAWAAFFNFLALFVFQLKVASTVGKGIIDPGAAVQAVSAWWFEPPLMGGKPVVVRVQIPFKFGETPKNTKAPASKAGAAKQE